MDDRRAVTGADLQGMTREALDEPGLKYAPKGLAERRREQMELIQRMREEAERAGRPVAQMNVMPDPEIGASSRANQLRFLKKVYDAAHPRAKKKI